MPWFEFQVHAFLASPLVQSLNAEEVGAYILLLCYQWEHGSIPLDDQRMLRRVARCVPDQDFLDEAFPGGVNPKLDEMRREAIEDLDRQVSNGRKGGRAAASNRCTDGAAPVQQVVHPPCTSGAAPVQQSTPQNRTGQDITEQNRDTPPTPPAGGAAQAPPGDPPAKPRKRQPRVDGKAELSKGLQEWHGRTSFEPPDDLVGACEDYRAMRARSRKPPWSSRQWADNFAASAWDAESMTEALKTATRSGWQSVHPRKVAAKPERKGF